MDIIDDDSLELTLSVKGTVVMPEAGSSSDSSGSLLVPLGAGFVVLAAAAGAFYFYRRSQMGDDLEDVFGAPDMGAQQETPAALPQTEQPPAVAPPQPEQPPAAAPPQPEQPPAAAPPQPEQPPAAAPPQPEQPPAAAPPQPEQPPAAAPPQPEQPPAAAPAPTLLSITVLQVLSQVNRYKSRHQMEDWSMLLFQKVCNQVHNFKSKFRNNDY